MALLDYLIARAFRPIREHDIQYVHDLLEATNKPEVEWSLSERRRLTLAAFAMKSAKIDEFDKIFAKMLQSRITTE